MAWNGYFEFDGNEIINASRTEKYAKQGGSGWFRAVYKNEALAPMLGETYNSPLQDDAPWTDPDNLDTYDFYGCYPLDVSGIEDSTASAPVIESTLDGGVVGRTRRSTRSVVFNLALIGASECAVEAGFRWLKSVVTGNPCSGRGSACAGASLCYLSCEPCIDWSMCDGQPELCLPGYRRTLLKVAATSGPTITGKQTLTDGGAVWIVSMTMVAGNPYEFGAEVPLINNFMKTDNPYVLTNLLDPETIPFFDDQGYQTQDVKCPVPAYQPLVDPNCPLEVLPPDVPQNVAVQLACFAFPPTFTRRSLTIPAELVPLWSEVVPSFTIKTGKKELRNLRIRFYADVLGSHDTENDPCAYCGDIVFSYIPPTSTMIFDGAEHNVYIDRPGHARQRADSVVFANDGGPFDWPELTCGHDYLVTLDMPNTQQTPSFDLTLTPRTV